MEQTRYHQALLEQILFRTSREGPVHIEQYKRLTLAYLNAFLFIRRRKTNQTRLLSEEKMVDILAKEYQHQYEASWQKWQKSATHTLTQYVQKVLDKKHKQHGFTCHLNRVQCTLTDQSFEVNR
jgi:hypothetical protein